MGFGGGRHGSPPVGVAPPSPPSRHGASGSPLLHCHRRKDKGGPPVATPRSRSSLREPGGRREGAAPVRDGSDAEKGGVAPRRGGEPVASIPSSDLSDDGRAGILPGEPTCRAGQARPMHAADAAGDAARCGTKGARGGSRGKAPKDAGGPSHLSSLIRVTQPRTLRSPQ